jgi:hypothetical protein
MRKYMHTMRNKPKHRKTRRTARNKTRRNRNKRGGSLGRIPQSAIVSIQQDPYSARMLVDAETAEDIFDARGPYLL